MSGKIVKLIVMYFSPASYCFLQLSPKYLGKRNKSDWKKRMPVPNYKQY